MRLKKTTTNKQQKKQPSPQRRDWSGERYSLNSMFRFLVLSFDNVTF